MDETKIECKIVSSSIDVGIILDRAGNDWFGAICSFVGTVRVSSSHPDRGEGVQRLEYEAFEPMAEKEMLRIAQEAIEQYGVGTVILHHRVGKLSLGEVAVVAAIGSPHRAEAFDACRFLIEELKKRVPIWKREVFEDGAIWVDPHP